MYIYIYIDSWIYRYLYSIYFRLLFSFLFCNNFINVVKYNFSIYDFSIITNTTGIRRLNKDSYLCFKIFIPLACK